MYPCWNDVALAVQSREIASIPTSGFIFKDTLKIHAIQDPQVSGVTLYLSDFARPLTEKLTGGDFFNDPSGSSLACAQTRPVTLSQTVLRSGSEGEEVFEESRNLFFKVGIYLLHRYQS